MESYGGPFITRAAATTVAALFDARATTHPDRIAIEEAVRSPITYGDLARRTRHLAGALAERGVGRGDRVAVFSENRYEYLEVFLASARLGALVACPSFRLAGAELGHCLALASPRLTFASRRHEMKLADQSETGDETITFGPDYEGLLDGPEIALAPDVDPEDGLLILYTSGTTGTPKGAVVSHRAQIARNLVTRTEFGITVDDAFCAWSPLSHMGAADNSLGTLMSGGTVVLVDGFDKARLAEVIATRDLGWLILMPGMIAAFADELTARDVTPRGVKICGAMADLVPPADIARITGLLRAPFANTFGATETGCPPCSSNRIPVGVAPAKLSKQASVFCEIRLVDAADHDVADGSPGELAMRGPTLFSGYWNATDTNTADFRGGWFHMGDVFIRNADGTLDFVDRAKYLIKTGGENVYPAEIERVLLEDPRVADAAVVRRPDSRWGEVPIAFVVVREGMTLAARELYARCRTALAGFKQPKGIVFVEAASMSRSVSGKVQRRDLEARLASAEVEIDAGGGERA